MNVSQLMSRIRNQIDDKIEPYLWDDEELLSYLNEAYIDFCKETEIIHDSRTPTGYRQLCTINLQADVASYSLNKKILNIKSAVLSNQVLLSKTNIPELDTVWCGWRNSKGMPRFFVLDSVSSKILLIPCPTAVEIGNGLKLYLEVTRLPLTSLSSGGDEPEFPEEYHKCLIPYVLMKAYEKEDVQTRRPDLVKKYELEYLQCIEKTKRKDIKYRNVTTIIPIHEGLL